KFAAGDPNSTVTTFEEVGGKVVPIWYARDHQGSLSCKQVQYVSEFPMPPGGKTVLGILALNLALGIGLRLRRPANQLAPRCDAEDVGGSPATTSSLKIP